MLNRARPEYLDKSLDSIDRTVGDPSSIDAWIYVDNDDDITKRYISSGSYLRFSFKINWVVGERTASMGQMINILREKCSTNPGIYMPWPDDYVLKTRNWDGTIRDVFSRYPDGIVMGYLPDPIVGRSEQVTLPVQSATWINITGKMTTELFPYWKEDTWLDHVAQLVQRKVRLDDVSVEPISGKGKTRRLKNLPFWDRFFNNLMDERIKEANLLRQAMYPKDSPQYQKSMEEAERLAETLMEKREKTTIDSLLAMERACSSFPEKPEPHLITLYLVLEARAVSHLCSKVDSLMQAGDFGKALKMLDNVVLAEQEYKNVNYLRAVCLTHLGRPNEAAQAARKELSLQPGHNASLEIAEQQLPHLPGETSLREQSQRLNDAAKSTTSQNITWEQIKQMPVIRLYAGDVPAQKEYEGVVGLSLTRNDRNHIRHDITKPFPLADNAVDSFQAEDVFEHIQYEKLLPVVNEIYRILKPGGLFRLSVPDYGCDVLQDRCKKSEKGQILFDPGGGGTSDNPGHVWFPRIDAIRQLLKKTKFHKSGTIEFLHHYNMDGTFVVKPIDYTRGHVTRTPDFDERVKNPRRPMSLVVDLTKATPLHIETKQKKRKKTPKAAKKRAEENSLQYPSFNALVSFLSSRDSYRPTIISTAEVFCGPDCETTMDADKYRTIKSPPGVYDIKPFIEQLPSHQTPELVVVKADATGRNFPINLQTLKCPKLLILGNTQHLKMPIRTLLEYALQEKFDFIMSDHKRHHLHYFKEAGFEKVFWLPAFNIFPHKQPHYEDKRYEVSFVGQAGKWHPYRKYILQYLKANGVPVNHFQVPPAEAAQIYAQSLVNLNVSLNGDLNLRVFEVLSSGGFLLTDKLTMESGLELLFKDGQHLVCFENDRDLLDKIQYFLKHPDEAKAIAQNGYEEFQRNHTPEKKIKELSDYILSGELNPLYDMKKDKRSIYVNTDSQTELIRRVALYEFFQELHLTTTSASILFWPEVDGRLACDVLDLPRLRLFIKNDGEQIPDQNTQLFQNTDMAKRIKLVTTEQLRQMDLFWNTLVITASELLTIGLENLLTSMKFKWLVISDGFDALEEQQRKTFKDILAAAGFEKRSEGLELYYWKDKNLWGEVLYSENKIAEAISCFGQALLENPSHCDALNNLGVISYQLEQFANAEKLLLKAVGLNRRNANTLINLAHLYLRMKRFDDAAELFKEAASLDKDDVSLWFHLGLCYEQSNRKTDALQAFKHCNELEAGKWPVAEKIRTLEKRTAAKRPKKTSKVILPPKRILVINNLYPPQELGGYGRLLCDFANILENRGHSIYVLTSDTPYLGPIDQDQSNVDRSLLLFGSWQNGVCKPIEDKEEIIRIIKKNDEKLQNAIKWFSPQLCLLGNIDFLSHSILQPLLKSGIPVIHHLGSPNPGYSVADTPKEKLYIPAAASRWLKEQIVQQGYAFKDFRVIYPGALVKQFKMNILPDMDKLRIAYASIVLPYKGPHILINALKKLHDMGVDFSCSLAGTSTDEKFVNSLKNFVTQTGMDEKVTFLGFLPRGDLKDFFARHNVLAFPSLVSEAFGISQVEAMAAGLTVVTSGTGGAKEIVEHRLSGLIFNSGDHHSLARELLQLAEDKERWRQIALAGQERALQSFDIEKSVDDIERIYCHLTQYSEKGIKRGRKTRSSSKRYMVGKKDSTPDISTIPSQNNRINPLVSIIMPAYNAAEYIAAAIESVLSQNYRNFELIIVDDGSTDNTKDIIAGFKDEKIKYFYKENAGAASARNLAIKKSKGDFLITLDADDMIAPDFIAKHLQQFEKHPETDLVYCDDYLIDEDGKPTQVSERPEYPDRKSLIKDLFRYGCPIVPFRTCIRKSVFDKIGFFDEDLLVGEDYDMMRRFVKSGLKIHHLKDALYLRRIIPNNLSRNSTAQNAKCHFEAVKRFTDTFAYDELFPDVSWDEIPPQMRQLHAKCLAAATYVAIGHAYIESNSPAYAERASKLACSELNDCLKIDPNNEQIRQLLQKYELLQAKWTEESPMSCFIGKT